MGSGILFDALNRLEDKDAYFLLVFGPVGPAFKQAVSIPFFSSGYVASPQILACLYSACDVFVNTSIIESFSYTCLESASCGVPSVAFDVGGTGCMIRHKETGYLASPYKAEEITDGIRYCLEHSGKLSASALGRAREAFDRDKTVRKYIEVYEAALRGAQASEGRSE